MIILSSESEEEELENCKCHIFMIVVKIETYNILC